MITNRWFVLLDALLDLWTVTVATLEVTAIGWNFAALFVETDSTLTSSGVPERNSVIFHNYLGCWAQFTTPEQILKYKLMKIYSIEWLKNTQGLLPVCGCTKIYDGTEDLG